MGKVNLIGFLSVACALTALAAFSTGATAQDFRKGLSGYNTKDWVVALNNWLPLAEQGHADSQAALGYMYLTGNGVVHDDDKAATWYMRAAQQKQPDAVYFLGTLYLNGRGVQKDYVRAYALCNVALSRGDSRGLKCRDDAADYLTAAEKKRAEGVVVKWQDLIERN